MKAEIDIETLNQLLEYLSHKPFREVTELIKIIQEAKPIEVKEE